MKAFVHHARRAVRVHSKELPQLVLLVGNVEPGAGEEAPLRVGDGVIELALRAVSVIGDEFEFVRSVPEPEAAVVGDGETSGAVQSVAIDLKASFDQGVFSRGLVIAIELEPDAVGPVKAAGVRVPDRTFSA